MQIRWWVVMIAAAVAFERPASACDPLAQTGCAGGEKCTQVNLDSLNDLVEVKCVADGAVALGGSCTYGPDGTDTGFDDCVAGGLCVFGACRAICSTTPDSCDADHACKTYAGVFSGPPMLGVCDDRCDPVTQVRLVDDAPACGSADPDAPDRGCYGVKDGPFTCTGVPLPAASLHQGDTAFGPTPTSAYVNGCAPGFAPIVRAANDATSPPICSAYCAPGPTSLEEPANANGLVGSGYQCADRGAAAPAHECRYLWRQETFDETTPPRHPDGVGFCWIPDDYVGDWDEDPATAAGPLPRCEDIPESAIGGRGCAPYATFMQLDAGVPDPDAALDPDAGDPGADSDEGGCCRASNTGADGAVFVALIALGWARTRRRR